MVTCGWSLLMVILSVTTESLGTQHGLEESVDDLIRDELGDDPFARRITAEDFKKAEEELNATTQDNETNFENETEEDLKERRLVFNGSQVLYNTQMRKMSEIMNITTNRLEDFKNNVDVFEELFQKARKTEPIINGRRASDLNNMLMETLLVDAEQSLQQELPPPSEYLAQKPNLRDNRESLLTKVQDKVEGVISNRLTGALLKVYIPHAVHANNRKKVLNMMYTLLYRAQYYVTYAQAQRKRWVHNARYRLGFCFALTKELVKEQRTLMYGILFNHYTQWRYHGVHTPWAVFTYEKIQKLQRDIRDVVHHIKQLEYERKMTEEPDYYKNSPSSTGRYSG